MINPSRLIWAPWRQVAGEAIEALDEAVVRRRFGMLRLVLLVAATTAAWFVYVPIHELAHAYGCLWAGGSVQELQIQALYGGKILARSIPFVRAGGAYAGRLSKFDTGGSDLVYLATDFAPYVLTVIAAFPLVRLARRLRSVTLLAAGIVLAFAPLVGLAGDYYEMGSIVVSAGIDAAAPALRPDPIAALRHDDLVALLGEFTARFPDHRPAWGAAVVVAAALGALLAGATLAASRAIANLFGRRPETPGA